MWTVSFQAFRYLNTAKFIDYGSFDTKEEAEECAGIISQGVWIDETPLTRL